MKAIKKVLSLGLIIALLSNYFFIPKLNAVDVNGAANPWTLEKAEHLARRALIGPNPDIIKALYDAGSSQNAVNILFPSVSGPDRTAYEAELEQFKQANFSSTDGTKMTKYYQYVYYKDPYEAKRKFFGLFEDIFSVDKTSEILYTDVENHYENLYTETLGNYKTLVKKTLFNTAKPESSYAEGQYLNLLNQPDKNAPNENYARELMQLFLMLEYKPWEDAETPLSVRNYSEADVAALAKILTGFRALEDKKVYFDYNYHNTSTGITFLDGELKSGDSFPFYNTASGTIDNTQIVNPINGNNGLGDNIIDYIFSKRGNEIADFVAYRMIKYYVSDAPTKEEIENVAGVLLNNNFDLYPTVKYLLASDMMYSDKSINSIRYKNPIELTVGTLKLLHYKNPSIDDVLLSDTSLLSNLDWAVYTPKSIFGRAGFDNNLNFMNAYFHNQWVTYTSKIAFTTGTGAYSLTDIIPETRKTDTGGLLQVKTSTGNTYSGSIKLTDINLTLAQQIVVGTQSEITTLDVSSDGENILLEKTSTGDILENTGALTDENTSSGEIDSSDSSGNSGTLMGENASSGETSSSNDSSTSIENTGNVTEAIPSLDIPVEIPENRNIGTERITPEISIPENTNEVSVPEMPSVEVPTSTETPAPEMPISNETSFLNLFFPKANAADILSNNITFSSGSLTIPTFSLTLSGGSISFTGSLDMSSKVLNITSGVLTYSGATYDITSGNAKITSDSTLDRDITIDEMIKQMEDYLYFGRRLPTSVKDSIKTFLLTTDTGTSRNFLPNDTNYKNKYIKAVFSMMLAQPEFLLQSGYDKTESLNSGNSSSPISGDSKLIMIELYGGYDWLHAMVPKNEYSNYLNVRTGMNFSTDELIDVGDYYLNKSYNAYKEFYDSGELRIVNRVGAPNHSRGHDTAAIQVTSQKALQTVGTPGIIGELIKNEQDPLKNIVLGTNRPTVYTNGNYLNIGSSSAVYRNNISSTTTNEKNYQISTLKNILTSRNYPGDLSATFKNSITLDTVATQSKASGGSEGAGGSFTGKLMFTKTLIDNNLGVTYYVPGGGGYDTHGDQQKAGTYNLTNRTTDLSNDIAKFFNQMKSENKDVTIIVFSEFGRTLKTNGTTGTDHGQGGGYFILTTNSKLKQAIPQKVVGDLSVTKEYNDWFGVGIDYRAIYSKILTSLYNINASDYFFGDYNLDDYINTTLPNPVLFRGEYKNTYGNNVITDFKFSVDDKNFIFKDGSYIKFFYGKDPNNLSEYSRWTLSNTALQKDGSFNLSLNLTKLQKYYYRVQVVDNQYDEYILNGSFVIPDKITNNAINQVSFSNDTYFTKYSGTSVNGIKDIEKLVLLNNPVELIPNETGSGSSGTGVTYTQSGSVKTISFTGTTITMTFGTGETSISQITSSTGKTWNGGFVIPTEINKTEFLSEKSLYDSKKISNYYVDKLLKVGADTLGVGMVLNQDVIIGTPLTNTSKDYVVLTSEDGETWANLGTGSLASGKLYFKTNHFSYFALVDSQILASSNTGSTGTGTQNPDTGSGSNTGTGGTNNGNGNTGTGKVLNSILKNKTEMAFSGKTIEEAFSMIGENIGNAYSFTGGQVMDVLTGAVNDNAGIIQDITIDETTNFYTTNGNLNFKKQVLSNETSTSGNTRYNFSGILRLGGDETIILDKVATIKFTSSSASKIAYRKNSSSNWNILSIQNGDCTPNFPSLCAYRSGNNVFIKTYHFTDFALVGEENISSNNNLNTSSSNGSGRGLVMDKCPMGDLSPSYYDRTCEASKMNSLKPIKKVEEKNTPPDEKTTGYKVVSEKFGKYTITKIEGYKSSSAINDLAKYVAGSRKIMPKDKDMIIKRLNDYLLARYELETSKDKSQLLRNKYQKQFILLKSALKKVN